MTEQDVRDVLGRALPDQAVVGITRESAVASGRRARLRRRVSLQAGAAAVFVGVVVAAAVVPWQLRGGGPAGLGASGSPEASPSLSASASATPSIAPTSLPAPGPTYPTKAPPATTAELSRNLRAAAARILPGAEFAPVVIGFAEGYRTLAPFDVVDNDVGFYIGQAQITTATATGLFTIAIWAHADNKKSPNPGCDANYVPRLSCQTSTGPHGEAITVDTGIMIGTTTTEYQVKVHRADGMILRATVSDAVLDPSAYSTPAPPPYHGVPMTTDQMVELLLTPGLDLASPGS